MRRYHHPSDQQKLNFNIVGLNHTCLTASIFLILSHFFSVRRMQHYQGNIPSLVKITLVNKLGNWGFRTGKGLENEIKSAHTALAVKGCFLGVISYTQCSMTFVNIAVAISALAGGVGQKTVSHRDRNFSTSPNPGGVFVVFGRFLDVWTWERIEMEFWVIWVILVKCWMEFWVILAGFRQWKKQPKVKKHCK